MCRACRRPIRHRRKRRGFTDRLAVFILLFLFVTILMGFYLALESIKQNYLGSLICFTAAIAPLGTALSIVLGKVVDKNKAENMGGNGDGIAFAAAQAAGFAQGHKHTNSTAETTACDVNSPEI